MPKVKTTKSTKRYAFLSFRERVDAIKIEPSKKLNRKAFDDTETSHFLASYERWSEINRSAVFTDFAESVETIIQSLPQILHYKSKIYEELINHIKKHDHLSLQPLLELLTQFCHDLGPDFMEFYEDAVNTLVSLALGQNDSNTLEWEFNCLAYMFKYLSRYLSQDLIPTLRLLEPLFTTKDHISRFSAEALAFLVRKASHDELSKVTKFIFMKLDDENYKKAVIILFSESMKSTRGSIHSKTPLIIRILLNNLSSDKSTIVFCDIVLSIISYGTQEAVEELYDVLLKESKEKFASNDEFLGVHLRIFTALVFADSGKKVPSWEKLYGTLESTIGGLNLQSINEANKPLIVYLFSLFMRNAEIQILSKSYNFIFRSVMHLDSFFLPFVIQIINLTKVRALKFSGSYVQEFVNRNWIEQSQQIAYFIEELKEKDLLGEKGDSEKISIVLPSTVGEHLKKEVEGLDLSSPSSPAKIFWRLSLLSHSSFYDKTFIESFFNEFEKTVENSSIKLTILSKLIGLIDTKDTSTAQNLILEHFSKLVSNKEFLNVAPKHMTIAFSQNRSNEELLQLIKCLTKNLISPDHEIRLNSLQLISVLSQSISEDLVNLSNQCLIIEQIPLSLETGRDIAIRMRNLANTFKSVKSSELINIVYFNFLFGQLTVKFSPSWEAVFEVLPTTYHKAPEIVWNLALSFINKDALDEESFSDLDTLQEEDVRVHEWDSVETRFASIVASLSTSINKYQNSGNSLVSMAEEKYTTARYPELISSHAIKVLQKIPELAEKNASVLESIVLRDQFEDNETENTNLNRKDRNSVLELFSLFKKLKKTPRAPELYDLFLRLLSSKFPEVRKIALSCLLNFKSEKVIKYKDNLSNLIDDSSFRDEVSTLLNSGSSSVLEDEDLEEVMPLILRVLYARAQITVTSGSKRGLKFSAINVLPNLDTKYVNMFIGFSFEKVHGGDEILDASEATSKDVSVSTLKVSQGFCNLLNDLLNTLGEKIAKVTASVLPPLINSLVVVQKLIDESNDGQLLTTARNVRQSGMKSLLLLFNLSTEFDWDIYIENIYENILAPRFVNFEDENLQQPSSLLKLIVSWSEVPAYHELLAINQNEPVKTVLSLLGNSNTKETVIEKILDLSTNIITLVPKKKKYQTLFSTVSESAFENLPSVLDRFADQKLYTKAIGLLLALVENRHVQSQEKRQDLVGFSTKLLEKPGAQISKDVKSQILKVLNALVFEFEGTFNDIEELFKVSCKFLKFITEREQRQLLVQLFVNMGEKFEEVQHVGSLVSDLSSYSKKQINEYDYERRLAAFRLINDTEYKEFSSLEWLPILNLMLFSINDDDLSVRTNSCFTLRRFIDTFSGQTEKRSDFTHLLKDLILPNVRSGLRHKEEQVQFEFISLFAHIVRNSENFAEFKDLQVLLFNGDEEADFFINITHVQLHRRQRAIKRLSDNADKVLGSNIAHYLLPIIERYAYYEDEKFRNISNETIIAIQQLMTYVTFKQYQAIFRRYLGSLKDEKRSLRDSVSLIVTISKALLSVVRRNEGKTETDQGYAMIGLPKDSSLDKYVELDLIAPISKVLNKRDDDTIVLRVPLVEGLASLILCLSHERIVSVLPGVLTNSCQVLRAKSDETRDAARKFLGRAADILGARYVKFILKELQTALSRGSQIHVLGFTVHSILSSMNLLHSELDESSEIIMEVVMENMFGSAGQEKEAENYRTTMKEIKHNKSFDIAEILTRVISLSHFNVVVNPIKLLLRERITLRVQNKLDELLRRISLGIYKNEELKSKSMLVLCYELFSESKRDFTKPVIAPKKDEGHFLVQLESKPLRVETENSLYADTFQKLSLDLLRTTLSKNESFLNPESLTGFLPFLEEAIKSDNEGVIISTLKVLGLIIDINFDTDADIFKTCARRSLTIIKNYPSTESELCQACYKYLSSIIRRREDLALKETSLGYLLIRIQPDLQEQNKQGLAFNFLKALVSKHVMIPEVYDTMDKVREVMVTSHSKERRDMSRSIYFQFIMEYDQGKGRLEKQFKFLVDNLSYPAETGQQSVMELIHLIMQKSGRELMEALSSSFFVALAKVLISDTSAKSREMAVALITSIFEKMGPENFEKYILGWIESHNSSLLKCSLQLYRIRLKVAPSLKGELDDIVLGHIKITLESSKVSAINSVKWELIYSSLSCLSLMVERDSSVLDENLKDLVINCLLFPHSWVRLASSRLVGNLVSTKDFFTDAELQNISYRLLHQLRAPTVDETLAAQIVKNLTQAAMYWETNGVLYNKQQKLDEQEVQGADDVVEADEEEEEKPDQKMADWIIQKVSGIARAERISFVSKKACVQLLALIIQIYDKTRILELSESLILPLFNLMEMEADTDQKEELQNSASECMKMIEEKIGVTDYTQSYSKVRQFVQDRRQERRSKRARLAITAPEAIARRKIKKHERSREKRKHEKDESGYYHTKKKSQRRN